ncbi:hypothetical protein AVEN_275273-1, partial [Araneus ventricosus]
ISFAPSEDEFDDDYPIPVEHEYSDDKSRDKG